MNVFFLLVLSVPILVVAAALLNTLISPPAEGRPKAFPWILAFFVVVIVAGIATFIVTTRRPAELVIEVSGPHGAGFVGEATIDGGTYTFDGVAPSDVRFDGRTIEVILIAEDPDAEHPLEIRLGGNVSPLTVQEPHGLRIAVVKQLTRVVSMQGGITEDEWTEEFARLYRGLSDETPILPSSEPADDEGANTPESAEPMNDQPQ